MRTKNIILVALFACNLQAQTIDSVKFRIHYAAEFKRWEDSEKFTQDDKVGYKESPFKKKKFVVHRQDFENMAEADVGALYNS